VSHHIIFITVCAENVCSSTNASAKTLTPLDIITFNNLATQSGPLAVDARFSSSMFEILVRQTAVKWTTDFRWFSGFTMIFWAGMRYPVWIHCCKCPNYDFCISQGSVATVLRLGGQNYGHLYHVSSRCCTPKIITSRPMFHGVIHKITLAQFFLRHGVYWYLNFCWTVWTLLILSEH